MKSKIAAFLIGASMVSAASAEILTFDDLSDVTLWHSTPMPVGYGGLQWVGWNYYSWSNAPYNPASGATRLLHPATWPVTQANSQNAIYSDSPVTPFIFDGAYLSGYSSDAFPKSVSFELIRKGVSVHYSSWLTPSATSVFLASGYTGEVDRVVMHGDTSFVTLDNFQFSFLTPDPAPVVPPPGTGGTGSSGDDSGSYAAPVPEPETYALMLAGLGLMGFVARRRKRI